MNKKSPESKQKESRTCIVCSTISPLSSWIDNKCPACKQLYILADEAVTCIKCGFLTTKADIKNGMCSKCRA